MARYIPYVHTVKSQLTKANKKAKKEGAKYDTREKNLQKG